MEKILHRVYFENYRPFKDPFSIIWKLGTGELPHYKVMRWEKTMLMSLSMIDEAFR